jgi:transposase
MNQALSEDQFAAFIGIDWADVKHDVCLLAVGSDEIEFSTLTHTPEAIAAWSSSLYQRFGGKPVAICVELDKGPLVYALREYDFLVMFPVNPLMLARFREAFATSGAKDDPSDARLQLELLLKHRDRLRPLNPSSPAIQALELLVKHRRRLISDKVRLISRLISVLKDYYPQVLTWFKDRDTMLFCDFLTRWPTLAEVQRSRPTTFERFFYTRRVRSAALIQRRIQGIKDARPLTTDESIIGPNTLMTRMLVAQLREVLTAIAQFDTQIACCAQQHPDFELFNALPGAGPALAPRLMVAFGDQRDRYACAADLQKYAGIAPVTERSGKQCSVHWRWRCPKFLRQTFIEWSRKSIYHSFWAQAFYQQKRAQGQSHQAAIRALAFKWIRILFRCWQDRRPYDESVYLSALQKRGSPLLKNLTCQI